MLTRTRACLAMALVCIAACGGDDSGGTDVLGGSLMVSGDVYDLETDALVSGAATVSTAGLLPTPTITVQGASFVMDGVPENSAFQIIASVPPTHRTTYSATVEVISSDVDGVKAYAVSETLLATLASGFGVTPSAATGVLFLQLVDEAGNPKAGVDVANIVLSGVTGASAPKFLDASLAPDSGATVSSASGWAVIFEVPPGVVDLGIAANATATLSMPTATIGSGAVTIAKVTVVDGAPPALPTNVSFAQTVFPIFSARGCVACHSGGGPGKDLGGLMLDAGVNLTYRELTEENPARANPQNPEGSLVLTMPSAESPPDGHPNITFTGPQDPDYVNILVWIREGAKNN
jgi:hypothetical protein